MNTSSRFLLGIFAAMCSFAASAVESTTETSSPVGMLEVNNQWYVKISNSVDIDTPLYVTIHKAENHWIVDGIFDKPPKLRSSDESELFMATRDLQRWTNFYKDMRKDCDTFEARQSDAQSVCTSSFAEKKTGLALAGVFFGGTGEIPFAYTDEKVKAAIHSIQPEQAMQVLAAFEQTSSSAQMLEQTIAENQQMERRRAYEATVVARKTAPIGAKDWCEQTVKDLGVGMQIEQTFTCQNYGVVNEATLRDEGWAVINKQERKVGYAPQLITVHDIAIEKVPR